MTKTLFLSFFLFLFGLNTSVASANKTDTKDFLVIPPNNDECANATPVLVNDGTDCTQFAVGSFVGATLSEQAAGCLSGNYDLWYSFVATSSTHIVTLQNTVGATLINCDIYKGDDCGNLTVLACSGTNVTAASNLTAGTTYKIRVWSNIQIGTDVQFEVCVTTIYSTITSNTTQFSIPELITDVLINNACTPIANVQWSTGTEGIGYFNKGLSSFPFEQGLVLSTGKAVSVPGPNTTILSQANSATGSGDADLSAVLAAQTPPQTATLYNAAFVEFDFVATTENISFNFIFASEEYGGFQCNYGDAFAFLLTDLTADTPAINLAVIPNTTIPVSVTTIRDSQYNPSCPSSNSAYFGSYYNTPSTMMSAPINFNGVTIPMIASSTVIPGNSYHIKIVIADSGDTTYNSAVFLEGSSFSAGELCADKIELITFIDSNNNGIKDEGESNFTLGSFAYQINDESQVHNVSSPIGTYILTDENPLNTYDFSFNVHPEYATYFAASSTAHNDITIPENSGVQTLYFPVTQLQDYNDLTVAIIPNGQPTAGFSYQNKIIFRNLGTTSTSGTITYTQDPAVMISFLDVNALNTPTGFTYDFTDLAPFETRIINIGFDVPSIPTVNINDVLTSSVAISAPADDININNNSFNIIQVVVASFDPNDKMETHGSQLNIDTFSQDDYLFYTIRFQNTGTANAQSVRIEDLLDSQLDEASVRMLSASHSYVMERIANQIIWKFDAINLPAQMNDEELSHGYLTFQVKLKPGFALGDIIPNSAEIYFDTNPAIVTNTFLSEFTTALSVKAFTSGNILLYPNPVNAILNLRLVNSVEIIQKISVYDIVGKLIKVPFEINAQQMTINVGNLSSGIYMLEVTTDNNLKQVRKFVVN